MHACFCSIWYSFVLALTLECQCPSSSYVFAVGCCMAWPVISGVGQWTSSCWCVQDVTRKVLLKSLHKDPHTTWVKGPSGKHTNVSALLDWPDNDDDDDSNDNSDSEPVSSPHNSITTTTSDSLHNVAAVGSQSRANSVDGEPPSATNDDGLSSVGKYMISKVSKQICTFVSRWRNGNMPDCGVRGSRFESHIGQLYLSWQPLRYTALSRAAILMKLMENIY